MCVKNYTRLLMWCFTTFMLASFVGSQAKISDVKVHNNTSEDFRIPNKVSGAGMALIFVEELKLIMERHVLGICPQSYKPVQGGKAKNNTATTCDLDVDPHELAGRLAALALRAHSAARSSDCSRLGVSLANAFGELARSAVHRQNLANNASAEANKKRKLSKSQKAKIQAKQKTALAVKKKAAAIAAKMTASVNTS